MQIGTVRPEEARAFDSREGFWQFRDGNGGQYGSFEVFWCNNGVDPVGWYWQACHPECLPDSDPTGPFSSSSRAYYDATEA